MSHTSLSAQLKQHIQEIVLNSADCLCIEKLQVQVAKAASTNFDYASNALAIWNRHARTCLLDEPAAGPSRLLEAIGRSAIVERAETHEPTYINICLRDDALAHQVRALSGARANVRTNVEDDSRLQDTLSFATRLQSDLSAARFDVIAVSELPPLMPESVDVTMQTLQAGLDRSTTSSANNRHLFLLLDELAEAESQACSRLAERIIDCVNLMRQEPRISSQQAINAARSEILTSLTALLS